MGNQRMVKRFIAMIVENVNTDKRFVLYRDCRKTLKTMI